MTYTVDHEAVRRYVENHPDIPAELRDRFVDFCTGMVAGHIAGRARDEVEQLTDAQIDAKVEATQATLTAMTDVERRLALAWIAGSDPATFVNAVERAQAITHNRQTSGETVVEDERGPVPGLTVFEQPEPWVNDDHGSRMTP
jgi:hypothetical protein